MEGAMQSLVPLSFRGRTLHVWNLGSVAIVQSQYGPHECLAEHCHARAYVSVVLRGSYRENCGICSWTCRTGSALFHAAGESHANQFDETGAVTLSFEILPDLLDRLRERGADVTRRIALTSPYCAQLGFKILREASSSDPLAELAIEGLVLELFAEVFRRPSSDSRTNSPDWLEQIRTRLQHSYREPETLGQLAAHAGVHPVHLARAFRKRYRCSIGNYIRALRIEAARRDLLSSRVPIAEIAARNGFADQSHLSRTLRRFTGLSPRDFRRVAPEA